MVLKVQSPIENKFFFKGPIDEFDNLSKQDLGNHRETCRKNYDIF